MDLADLTEVVFDPGLRRRTRWRGRSRRAGTAGTAHGASEEELGTNRGGCEKVSESFLPRCLGGSGDLRNRLDKYGDV